MIYIKKIQYHGSETDMTITYTTDYNSYETTQSVSSFYNLCRCLGDYNITFQNISNTSTLRVNSIESNILNCENGSFNTISPKTMVLNTASSENCVGYDPKCAKCNKELFYSDHIALKYKRTKSSVQICNDCLGSALDKLFEFGDVSETERILYKK